MSYTIEIKIASKNGWFTPAEARAYYGRYDRNGATVHWWNDPSLVKDSDHDNIVNYMLNGAAAGQKSVNYVASNKKITLVVNPDNVAWASQSGNPTTISIEFSPHLNDEGYKKAGWLINELEGRYGRTLQLFPHKYWYQTSCPGTLSLDRIRQEANKWKSGGYNPTPPAPVVPEWKRNLKAIPSKTMYAIDDNTPMRNLVNTPQVIKNFTKGTSFEIAGQTQVGAYPYYLTKYSMDNNIGNGFDFYELQDTNPNTPPPDTRPEWERNKKELPVVTMYTLANAKLVNVNTLAVIQEFPLDTPMEIKGETTVNSKRFLFTTSSFDGNRPTGFLEGDLKVGPEPKPEPEPEKPEWEKNLRDIDDTKMWVKLDTSLRDIKTGGVASPGKLFAKNDEFVASALTIANGVEYRLTDYSFKKGIFNGLPIAELTLTEPGEPNIPPVPEDPTLIKKSVVIEFLESIVKLITDFIKKLKG